MRRRIALAAVLTLASFLVAALYTYAQSVAAAPSQNIPYQGYLEKDGSPVSGSVDMVFRLWKHPTSTTAANKLWQESRTAVPVSAGRFALLLGEVTAIPATVFSQQQLYLDIAVIAGAQIDLLGRPQLGATPFARGSDPGGLFVGQDRFEVRTVSSGVADDATTSDAPYSRVSADSFHSNGIGMGQLFIEGRYIDANNTIAIGTGVAGGQSAQAVQIGGNTSITGDVTASGNVSGANATFSGTMTAAALAGAWDKSGSNYVRLGDLQIAWGEVFISGVTFSAVVFPQPFLQAPRVVTGSNTRTAYNCTTGESGVDYRTATGTRIYKEAGADNVCSWTAIGRWR